MLVRPFTSLLIANRGEIACRVIRTAKGMGLRTIAVFSEADASAQHVKAADEARLIGRPPVRQSYLDIERDLEAAKKLDRPGLRVHCTNTIMRTAEDKAKLARTVLALLSAESARAADPS